MSPLFPSEIERSGGRAKSLAIPSVLIAEGAYKEGDGEFAFLSRRDDGSNMNLTVLSGGWRGKSDPSPQEGASRGPARPLDMHRCGGLSSGSASPAPSAGS